MVTIEQIKSFIEQIAPIIKEECHKRGYSYPSAIIAQACCESAYGTSQLGYKYHNYFGMKCGSSWTGKSVNMTTKEEYKVGTITTIKDNFRVYDSMEDGVAGYFDFISKPRYQSLKTATSSRGYIELIKACGYATSSTYVSTVYSIVQKYDLTLYDNFHQTKEVDPEIVERVMKGELGNAAVRVQNLMTLGYNPNDVQKKVNEIITIQGTINELKKELGKYWKLINTV